MDNGKHPKRKWDDWLHEAWRVQSFDRGHFGEDVDKEAILDLEQLMFECSKRAGEAGERQWGINTSGLQDGWDPYTEVPRHWNLGNFLKEITREHDKSDKRVMKRKHATDKKTDSDSDNGKEECKVKHVKDEGHKVPIKKIVERKRDKKTKAWVYLVKWVGYPEEENKWKYYSDIKTCTALDDFFKEHDLDNLGRSQCKTH
ncbi:hypothetical protein AN958_11361 [Leucoagaricus sp. SymC.cos]|nr:hypothetical protein AN958_11361 [Leucoagaricus sp. SymC.cos]